MNTQITKRFLVPVLMASLALMLAGRVTAQTFTTVHSFTGGSGGAHPFAGLIRSENTNYGTTVSGGDSGIGTVFAVDTGGLVLILHSFAGYPSDGGEPRAGLILSGNTLYGTTYAGGSVGYGTVFAVNKNGSGFTILHHFTGGSDGARPDAGLILSGNTLYGTAREGGSSGTGTVFAVNTDGSGFTIVHSFTGSAVPVGELILSGNTLYGMATGGFAGLTSVFAVNTNGVGFTFLGSFAGGSPAAFGSHGGLLLSGDTLYGATRFGGSSDSGTLFKLNTNGTGSTILHHFSGGSGGGDPHAGLILSGNTLYGTTFGGSLGAGTIFAVTTSGTGFTILHSFIHSDGANPAAGLILSCNTLYGATSFGGGPGYGTVFKMEDISPPAITCPPDLCVASDAGSCSASGVNLGTATSSDCAVASIENNAPASFPLGVTTVTWTARDDAGNALSTCEQEVTVISSVSVAWQPPLAEEPAANTVRAGQVVRHDVDLKDCAAALPSGVTVRLKVQGIQQTTAGEVVFQDVVEDAKGIGVDGTVANDGIMVLRSSHYQFYLDTGNFSDPNTTAEADKFYRSTVTVIDDATGCELGRSSITLETRR